MSHDFGHQGLADLAPSHKRPTPSKPAVCSSRQTSDCAPGPSPVAVTSTTEWREPDAHVARGEAMQVPGAATRDLLGLGPEQPRELPLEAQPRVLLDDAVAD